MRRQSPGARTPLASTRTPHQPHAEPGHLLRCRWAERQPPRPAVHDVSRASSKASRSRRPVPGKNPVMQTDEQLAIPPERRVVGPPQDKAHGVPVATHESGVLLTRFRRPVAGQNPVNLLHRDRDSFHRRRRRHGLCLEIALQSPRPRPANRSPVVELRLPAVELSRQLHQAADVVGKQHDWSAPSIT